MLSKENLNKILGYQKNEITEYHIYRMLAEVEKSPGNKKVLNDIAEDELRHYGCWRELTQRDVKPDRFKIFKYYFISRIFGLTFGVKLMEKGEEGAQVSYGRFDGLAELAGKIMKEENEHEKALLNMIDEERLQYTGSMILGLNDALVELTGALAGFTFALSDTRLIALTGAITGFAASFSMAASEYLSTKSEKSDKHPLKASVYTGTAYVLTVILLIMPYLVLDNRFVSLACTLSTAVLIIAFFNFYISVARDESFKARFLEMAGLSFGVAALSLLAGFVLRSFIGVDA